MGRPWGGGCQERGGARIGRGATSGNGSRERGSRERQWRGARVEAGRAGAHSTTTYVARCFAGGVAFIFRPRGIVLKSDLLRASGIASELDLS